MLKQKEVHIHRELEAKLRNDYEKHLGTSKESFIKDQIEKKIKDDYDAVHINLKLAYIRE